MSRMLCRLLIAGFVGVTLAGLSTEISAQAPRLTSGRAIRSYLYSRPTVSPYLNLLRNTNTGLSGTNQPNYQTLVRPQLEQRQASRLQQTQLSTIRRQVQTQQQSIEQIRRSHAENVFATGHQTRFMNYSSYYPALGRGQ